MAHTTFEELQKVVQLLKDAEQLADAEIRRQVQQLILSTTNTPPTPALPPITPVSIAPLPPATVVATNGTSWSALHEHSGRGRSKRPANRMSAIPEAGTQRSKVYEAVAVLGSPSKPVAVPDLEGALDGIPNDSIAKILSQLWEDGLLGRRQLEAQARDGYARNLYHYYVAEGSV